MWLWMSNERSQAAWCHSCPWLRVVLPKHYTTPIHQLERLQTSHHSVATWLKRSQCLLACIRRLYCVPSTFRSKVESSFTKSPRICQCILHAISNLLSSYEHESSQRTGRAGHLIRKLYLVIPSGWLQATCAGNQKSERFLMYSYFNYINRTDSGYFQK